MAQPLPSAPFDVRLARLHRARVSRGFLQHAFLHRRAAEDLAERLEAIPRRFERVLALGAPELVRAAIAARPALAARVGTIVGADSVAALAPGGVALDPERLAFAAEQFDLIVSPLLLNWVNDLVGALVQSRRALKPDGLFLGAVFGGDTLTELRQALLAAELDVRGGAGPRVAPFGDVIALAGVVQRAGFALPAADRDVLVVRYAEPLKLLADLRAMGDTNALAERGGPLTRRVLFRALEIYRDRFSDPDGRARASFEIVTLTGWAPHASQQQPLRPGSAKARLADALGVRERRAGDKAG